MKDLTDEDLLDERGAISGLVFVERLGVLRKIPTDRYSFAKQETDIRAEDKVCERGEKIGEVVGDRHRSAHDRHQKDEEGRERLTQSPFSWTQEDLRAMSWRMLCSASEHGSTSNGIGAPGPYRAARDLLLTRSPRLEDGTGTLILPDESTVDAAKRIGTRLDYSVLPIQGPPGSGKTFTGARMICELVRQGKKVGITAMSHKVIQNLLVEVIKAAK